MRFAAELTLGAGGLEFKSPRPDQSKQPFGDHNRFGMDQLQDVSAQTVFQIGDFAVPLDFGGVFGFGGSGLTLSFRQSGATRNPSFFFPTSHHFAPAIRYLGNNLGTIAAEYPRKP